MPLIRQPLIDPGVREAVVLHLGDLHRTGEHLKRSAREEAESVLAAARAERDRIIAGASAEGRSAGTQQGLREGRERGLQEGKTQAVSEWKQRLTALETGWSTALKTFLAERDRMLLEARQDVLRLAIMLAERITKRTIEVDPRVVADQMAEVLAVVARPTRLVISIHPEDRPVVEEVLPGLRATFPQAQPLELVDDPALTRGSCVARMAGGRIDASISTQLDRLAAALIPGGLAEARLATEEPRPEPAS